MAGPHSHPHQSQLLQRAKSSSNDDKEDSVESPQNAEPTEDINPRNKLFCVSDGYENDEGINKTMACLWDTVNASFDNNIGLKQKAQSTAANSSESEHTNCLNVCRILCDLETAFEVIEIIILLQLLHLLLYGVLEQIRYCFIIYISNLYINIWFISIKYA